MNLHAGCPRCRDKVDTGLAGLEEVKSGEEASAGDALQGQLCEEEPSFLGTAATLVLTAADLLRNEALCAVCAPDQLGQGRSCGPSTCLLAEGTSVCNIG